MTTGIVLSHITFALVLFLLLPTAKLPGWGRVAALGGTMLLATFPVDGLSLAEYVYSLTSDLSMSALFWMAWCAGARVLGLPPMSERRHLQLALCFSALALLLYPASLGLSIFDPYRWGYAPGVLLAIILGISVVLWLIRHYFGATLFTVATAIYTLDFRSPDNYWDYLIDPLLGLYCLFVLAGYFSGRIGGLLQERFKWTISLVPSSSALEDSPGRRDSPMTTFCRADGLENTN